VDCAGSAEEALARLSRNSYDIILCDINLPGFSGEELLRRVRAKTGATVPHFIFMTGDVLDQDAWKPADGAPAQILQKPFHISSLSSLLREILQPQASRIGPS